ncbi:MAG: 50S ribosomal protein L3 [Minisyncoccia bacterium]
MKFILGEKKEMTQVFDEKGVVTPVTILSAGPIVVTQVKNKEKDGYEGVQVGFGTRRATRISKPVQGHTKELGNFKVLQEFAGENLGLERGAKIDVSVFAPGDLVRVSAVTKGKGFQGVVKRHGFKGGPRTHGQKHSEREPGSIGGGLRSKVPKGKRMAGRMGGTKITVTNLKVVQVLPETNEILIKGAIPGRRGTLVTISQM